MKYLSIFLTALLSTATYGAEFSEPDFSETDMQLKYQQALDYLDTLSKTRPEAKDSKNWLINAQANWELYRTADCRAESSLSDFDACRDLVFLGCMKERSDLRAAELAKFIKNQS